MKLRIYKIPKGLTKAAAYKAARRRDGCRDWRAFTYNKKTGKATFL